MKKVMFLLAAAVITLGVNAQGAEKKEGTKPAEKKEAGAAKHDDKGGAKHEGKDGAKHDGAKKEEKKEAPKK